MKLFFCLLFSVFFSGALKASVEIEAFKKSSWNNSWNESIEKTLKEEAYQHMLSDELDEADLKELACTHYNEHKQIEEKIDFWIVFFSALTRAESAFNPHAKSKAPKGGHGNYGLLQFSKSTGRERCGLRGMEELLDPAMQLSCGVKLLSWQLLGAPSSNGKLLRPDLKGQLFGKYILLWGPLRQNDKRGRSLLVSWFKDHLAQLPVCRS